MRRFISLLCVLGLVLIAPPLAAQDDETTRKEELARELMEVTRAGDMGRQVMEHMIGQFRTSSPDVPDAFWDRFLASTDAGKLEEMVVPIYVEHLTAEEMEAAVEFYRTPAGQALIEKMPVIMQESMQKGQEFGMEVAQEIQRELEAYEQEETVEETEEEAETP